MTSQVPAEVSFDEIKAIEPCSNFFGACNKIKVGKKVIAFETGRQDRTRISFRKGVGQSKRGEKFDDFNIMVEREEDEMTRCNLGHPHPTGKTRREFFHIQIDWEMAQRLSEFIQTGTWRQVR